MKPDVEEAIARLTEASETHYRIVHRMEDGPTGPYLVEVNEADLRTLLDAYASREAEVKEAVRLLGGVLLYHGASPLPESYVTAATTYVTNHEASDGK